MSIGVAGDAIGNVHDARPKPKVRPTRDALLKLPSEQLKELWETALNKQLEEVERLGEPEIFVDALRKEKQQVKRFNAAAADKAYARAR